MSSSVLVLMCVWLETFLTSWCEGSYENLYGGIVAQSIVNVSENNPDVSEAVAFALRQAKLDEEGCRVTYMDKQRLFYSKDNNMPLLKRAIHGGHVAGGGKPSIQKTQSVLGLLYSFLVHCHSHGEESEREHCFVVTRDRNKDYHMFRKTTKRTNVPLTCRQTDNSPLNALVPTPILSSNLSSDRSGLKVASYNIWNVNVLNHKGETYEHRMKRLGKLVNYVRPDIIGFQEVRLEVGSRHGKKKQPALSQTTFLANALKDYQFVFQPAMLYMEKPLERKEEGVAIFSHYPIISSSYRLLSRNDTDSEDYHQRICLHAEILTPQFGSVHVFVSHLSLSVTSRERTVVEIWQYMQEYSGLKLLMGDLNAEPHERAMRFLNGEVILFGERTRGLVDLWQLQKQKSGREEQGFTFNALDEEPVKRIDYIFASFPQNQRIGVDETSVTNDMHICSRPCSDHYMVQATLTSGQCLI